MAVENKSQDGQAARIVHLLTKRHDEILNLWIKDRLESGDFRDELVSKKVLRNQSEQIVDMLASAIKESGGGDLSSTAFGELRALLNEISHTRAVKGYRPTENATYILSLRNTLLPLLAEEMNGDSAGLVREMNYFTNLLDKMSLVMVENYIHSREEIIRQQRADMLELSTPVIKVWDKILTLPVIGTLDSRRAQVDSRSKAAKGTIAIASERGRSNDRHMEPPVSERRSRRRCLFRA